MASNPTATLSALLGASTIEDHEEVLKAVNSVLKTSKSDENALHTQIIALLKLDRFDDALRILAGGGEKLNERCILEKAYALYKTGQLEEADQTVKTAGQSASRGLKHVAAQIAYRAEQFEQSAAIYKELGSRGNATDGEDNDLKINSSAVDAQLEWQGIGSGSDKNSKRPGREYLEAFETAYNGACVYIARGEMAAGSVFLQRARDLCNSSDELTENEKRNEVLPILIQEAYVWMKRGRAEEAEKVQQKVQIVDVPEAPTRFVAQINYLAASSSRNSFVSQQILDSTPKLSATDKLFKYQTDILNRNRYALDLQSLKFAGVARSSSAALSKNPSPSLSVATNGLSVVNAAATAECQNGKEGIKQMLPLLEKRPVEIGLILLIVQLYVITNDFSAATTTVESLFKILEDSKTPEYQNARFGPGLVALLVSLYNLQGRKSPAKAELRKAASYWHNKLDPPQSLLRAAGLTLLKSSTLSDVSAAKEIFKNLHKKDTSDKMAIAGYIASTESMDFSIRQDDLDKLTTTEKLIHGVDAAALESGGIASLPVVMAEVSRKRGITTEAEQPRKKRLRKSKLPKDFEEGKKMDPERWLPLKDRSSYRAKGKKGKKKALEATQGGPVKDGESLELVGGAGAVKVEKASVGKAKRKKGKK